VSDAAGAAIGPNALLQLAPVLEAEGGPDLLARILGLAGVPGLPPEDRMMPLHQAVQVHQALRRDRPEAAPRLLAEAGAGVGRYILAHRIPLPAQRLLRLLPAPLAARALSAAIAKHAWTFVGTGQLARPDPWTYQIAANPLVAGERSEAPLCHWHAAVFSTLYSALVRPGTRFVETRCSACGDAACRFEAAPH